MKKSARKRWTKRVKKSAKKMGADFKKSPLARASRGERVKL